jgi:cobalt-zinc-cadmium efflux system outer membrane protein
MKSLFSNDQPSRSFSTATVLALAILAASSATQAKPQVSSLLVNDVIEYQSPVTAATTTTISEPQGTLSLEQAIALASQYQPLQSVWQGRQQIAAANLQQSKLWDNPEISIDQTGLRQKDERELSIGVSQRLDVFGVRSARQKLASIALESEQVRQLAYQSQLKLAVTAAYWRVAQAEWAVKLQQDQSSLSANSEQAAKRRLTAGRIAEVEYSRVLVAHQQAQSQLTAAQAALQEARFQLSRLWGNTQPVFTSTQSGVNDTDLKASVGWPSINPEHIAAGLSDNPQQSLLRQQQRQAEAALNLAQAQARPQPTVSLGVNQTKTPSVQNGTDNRLTLGVSIPIPVFNRNQGVIKATRALSDITLAQQRYTLSKRQEQVQAGLIKLNALSSQYQQLQQQQLPLAKSIQQKTLQGFEAGKFSVTEVQQATREYQAIQFNQLQLLSQAWQLSLQMDALSLGLDAAFDINDSNYLDNSQFQLWQDAQSMPIIGAGE